jgi:hypothetical protein
VSEPAEAARRPPFDAIVALYRKAIRFYGWLLAGILALGLSALAAWELLVPLVSLPFFGFAVFVLSLAVLPAREIVERRDRIQGIEVLREEWDELVTIAGGADNLRLRRLIERLCRVTD